MADEDLRQLPNGDLLSMKEVQVSHDEAWSDYGLALRDPSTPPSRLAALRGKVELWSKTLHQGFEPEGQAIRRDPDARRTWPDDHRPSALGPAVGREFDDMIAAETARWRADPTNPVLKFRVESLERRRARDRGEQDTIRES